ncbi:hypothetical protein YC2023_043422 [Brassica napus]
MTKLSIKSTPRFLTEACVPVVINLMVKFQYGEATRVRVPVTGELTFRHHQSQGTDTWQHMTSLDYFISCFYAHYGDSDSEFISVRDFLSDSGNTNADQSQAIQDAWKALCAGKSKSLVIHANEDYTLLPQVFQGPCVASNPHIQVFTS